MRVFSRHLRGKREGGREGGRFGELIARRVVKETRSRFLSRKGKFVSWASSAATCGKEGGREEGREGW